MARQVPTQADLDQTAADFDTFVLPVEGSLQLGNRTAYGTTDPAVNLSMVNVAHLNDTRMFRGAWNANPADRGEPVPYTGGQVVIGSDNHLYVRSDTNLDTNPNPVGNIGTQWTILSSALDQPVTELTSTPVTADANLFAAGSSTFEIRSSANSSLVEPDMNVTTANIAGTPTTGFTGNTLTVNYEAQSNPDASLIVTTDARSSSFEGTHEGGQVDSIVNFIDGRQDPIITPEVNRVSILTPPAGAFTESTVYTVQLVPTGTSVAAGSAYAVRWRARQGTALSGFSLAPTYTAPFPNVTEDITFEYELAAGTIQTGTPDNVTRTLRVYTPWFYQFSDTVPTALTGATLALRQGENQADDFSTSNMIAPIAGTVGSVGFLYLFVDATMTQAITIGAGIARATGERLPAANNITVPNRNGNGNVTYALHRFRLGLAQSPTNFTITTA